MDDFDHVLIPAFQVLLNRVHEIHCSCLFFEECLNFNSKKIKRMFSMILSLNSSNVISPARFAAISDQRVESVLTTSSAVL